MTPQDKAKELVDKYYQTTPNEAWYNPPLGSLSMEYKAWGQAKECALIAVDELIKIALWGGDCDEQIEPDSKEYFVLVKREIEKL